jgi:hypothetical protein
METLSTGTKSPLFEKVLRWGLLGGILYGGMKLVNWITPFILESVGNMVALGGVALLVMLFLLNAKTLYLWYLGFCKKVTGWIIAMDPLSVMNGYLIKLRKKISNIQKTLVYISGKKIELQRLIEEKSKSQQEFTRLALAAKAQGEMNAASLNAMKAQGCKETVDLYTPIYNKYVENVDFLQKLKENWDNTADSLAFNIEIKTEQFNTLKAMFKGLKSIDDLTSSGSADAQAFAMSLKALEADTSQRLAYIDDFENRAKPLLTNMKVEKQAKQNDAMAFLEEASKDQNLLLPDYKSFTPSLNKVQDIDYVEVKNNKYQI